jgi:hypothetical protein
MMTQCIIFLSWSRNENPREECIKERGKGVQEDLSVEKTRKGNIRRNQC